jgi:tRNA dimethylallyltransferase
MMIPLDETTDAILITGPTASGKSALALEWADRYNGVIINADSMQVYDTLSVLTARPGAADLAAADHRLYGHVPALVAYSTGQWLRDVKAEIGKLREAGRLPIFVGGTGLYFRALTGGLSDMPAIPDHIRRTWRSALEEEGPAALHARLASLDPQTAARLQPSDGQRIVRALEVLEASGRPMSSLAVGGGEMIVDPARARKIVVLPDRARLHERINRRFEEMLEGEAVEEVRRLLALAPPVELPVMKAIGVRQIASLLEGAMSRRQVIEEASAATRQYAKRQMTWFRNQMDESWERLVR